MNDIRNREESVFMAALELANAGERKLFLEQACVGDAGLRAAVEELLMAQAETELFFAEGMSSLKPPAGDDAATGRAHPPKDARFAELAAPEQPGLRIGRYRIREKIGEGGGGVVYLAEQEEPVRRLVALKVIRLGMDTKNVIARFEAERQALAMMDHPNIARVFDAGATETGRPYFVMELVRGVKITDYCDQHQLDTRERLALFIQICRAIQHAHQKGIIHRDIKPSNILVTNPDAGAPGMPKVIDFGIAKATGAQLTDKTQLTAHEHPLGTPAYMSPEQVEMRGTDVDTRSDIYSLGVVLYELLAGRPPFDSKELLRSGLFGMRRTLLETEPQRPSTMLTTLRGAELTTAAAQRRADPPKLASQLRGDLDWIVMKALEKDRTRRYETANGLAMDLQRHLDNEPVTARPPSRLYQFQKLVRRNWVVFASAAVVAATLVIGLGASTWLFLKEREALAREAVLRQQAEAREKITQVMVLVGNKKFEDAEALLGRISTPITAPSLEAANVFRSLGEWRAFQGQWRQAADYFARLLQVNDADKSDKSENATGDLLRAGPALAELGDRAGYESFRLAAIARFAGTMNPVAAEQVIKTGLLLPASGEVLKSLDPYAEVAANSVTRAGPAMSGGTFLVAWRWVCLAMMDYRRGNWTKAAGYSRTSLEYVSSPVQEATARVILAMACHQLHQDDQARLELARGRELIEAGFLNGLGYGNDAQGRWFDWLIARIYLREATTLMEGPATANF